MNAKTFRMLGLALALMAPFALTAAWAESATADGQLQKIDNAAGKVTIKHGPIKELDMPDAMTMVYRVKDPAMLKTVKSGDKVHFELDRDNSGYVVTHIEKK